MSRRCSPRLRPILKTTVTPASESEDEDEKKTQKRDDVIVTPKMERKTERKFFKKQSTDPVLKKQTLRQNIVPEKEVLVAVTPKRKRSTERLVQSERRPKTRRPLLPIKPASNRKRPVKSPLDPWDKAINKNVS